MRSKIIKSLVLVGFISMATYQCFGQNGGETERADQSMSLKDKIESACALFGVFFGAVAAGNLIIQIGKNRAVRKEELRWKQATAAKQIIDEMFDEPMSKAASLMLDSPSREYLIRNEYVLITQKQVFDALAFQKPDGANGKQWIIEQTYIRDCFDYFSTTFR